MYRRCLEVAKASVGDHPEASLGFARNLSVYFYGLRAVLIKQGKREEADACRREALASGSSLADFLALRNEQGNPDIVIYRAEILARLGRWGDAARALARARELVGDDSIVLWRSLVRILFQVGELDAFRRHCTMSLERFSGTKDLNLALDVAMNCLISPSSDYDLTKVTRMAETACNLGHGSSKYSWYEFCHGLAQYRQDRFPEALETMEKVLAESTGESRTPAYRALPGDPSEREVVAYAVLAMAQERLHHQVEARDTLAKAQQIANTKLGKPGEEDLSFVWSDWIIAQALLREAMELIEGSGSQAAESSVQPKSE
jgi:tetratricopeptide (TPR) repeat protein